MRRFYISLIVCILLFSVVRPTRSDALGVDTLVKVAAGSTGEKVLVSLVEKSGVKGLSDDFHEKMLAAYQKRIKDKVAEAESIGKDYEAQELIRMNNMIANAKPADLVPADVNGYSKFVINTAMFLTGADVIYDVYAEIKAAQDKQKMIEVAADYARGLANGEYFTSYAGYSIFYKLDETYGTPWCGVKFPEGGTLGTGYDSTQPYLFKLVVYPFVLDGKNLYELHFEGFKNTSKQINTFITTVGDAQLLGTDATKMTNPPSVGFADSVDPLLDNLRQDGLQTTNETNPVVVPDDYSQTTDLVVPNGDLTNDNTQISNDPFTKNSTDTGGTGTTTGTDTGTSTDLPSPGKKLDFKPLSKSFGDFTRKFPFSIPWDLSRQLNVFNVEPKAPELKIDFSKFPYADPGTSWTLSLKIFDPVAAAARWFLTIAMDIAFILMLRRLLPE